MCYTYSHQGEPVPRVIDLIRTVSRQLSILRFEIEVREVALEDVCSSHNNPLALFQFPRTVGRHPRLRSSRNSVPRSSVAQNLAGVFVSRLAIPRAVLGSKGRGLVPAEINEIDQFSHQPR